MPKGKVKAEDLEPAAYRGAIEHAAKPLVAMLANRTPGSRFTEEEEKVILAVLAMCDGNVHRTSRIAGIPMQSVWQIKQREMVAFEEIRGRWKRSHALKTADIADMMADKIAQKVETEDSSLRDLAVAWGITVQRGAELAGEGSTVNVKHTYAVDVAALEGAMARLQQLRPVEGDVIDVTGSEWEVPE